MNPELQRAVRLYRAFREADPSRARRVQVSLPKAVARVGTVEFIGYMTTHRGKVHLYVHDFAPGSRPSLYAGTRRNQLYLFNGRFKVTSRGITDMDSHGRVVDYTPRYEHKPRPRKRPGAPCIVGSRVRKPGAARNVCAKRGGFRTVP